MRRPPTPSGRTSSHFFDEPSLLQIEHPISVLNLRQAVARPAMSSKTQGIFCECELHDKYARRGQALGP